MSNNGERKKPRDTVNFTPEGRFAPGNVISKLGGRPKGSMDLFSICKRKAKELDVDLEDMVWAIVTGLAKRAAEKGDPFAAKVVLDRLCGLQERGTSDVHVEVDARSVNVGPPPPDGKDLGQWITRLAEVAAEQGLTSSSNDDGNADG